MKKNITFAAFISSLATVFSAIAGYAQTASGASGALFDSNSTLTGVIKEILKLFSNIVPLLIGAAVVVFLWGIFVFIAKSSVGNADGRKEGINFMIFGIIGIAVMVSLWGLVAFVTSTFGTCSTPPCVPQFNSGILQDGTQRQDIVPLPGGLDNSRQA